MGLPSRTSHLYKPDVREPDVWPASRRATGHAGLLAHMHIRWQSRVFSTSAIGNTRRVFFFS